MLRLSVTTTVPARKTPGNMSFTFETEAETVDAVFEKLASEGMIIGHRVFAEQRENGEWVVAARRRIIIGRDIVGTIVECHYTYSEAAAA